MPNIYALVAEVLAVVGLLVGAAFVVKGYNNTQRNEAVLEDRAKGAEETAKAAEAGEAKERGLREAADKLANQRLKERDAARAENAQRQKGYQDDRKADKKVDDWYTEPVPAAIRMRRNSGRADDRNPEAHVRDSGRPSGAESSGQQR